MANLLKETKRGLRRRSAALLHRAVNASRPWLKSHIAPILCYTDMLIIDYGIARVLYNNRHRISNNAWRSAQPTPHHIGWIARQGVKTVINLRGDQSFGTRWLEEQACRRHGLTLVDLKAGSRTAPSKETLFAMRDLLRHAEYPILVHCKSGADRAGLMSVIVHHEKDGVPILQAREHLSLRYGHFKHADTGVLDAVFDRYITDNEKQPIEFWDWVERIYDPDDINRSFKATGFANRIVDGILRRE